MSPSISAPETVLLNPPKGYEGGGCKGESVSSVCSSGVAVRGGGSKLEGVGKAGSCRNIVDPCSSMLWKQGWRQKTVGIQQLLSVLDDDNKVIGDVLRIRQILTNLISNAVKFTHKGKVGVNLQLLSEQYPGRSIAQIPPAESSRSGFIKGNFLKSQKCSNKGIIHSSDDKEDCGNGNNASESASLAFVEKHQPCEKIVFLHCDVYDTGIGIPEKALPSLFKRYMQVSADHARKYGGTGLGLAICKQLVELMGGRLTVTSQVNCGSTFTFILPCKLLQKQDGSDDSDGESTMSRCEAKRATDFDELDGSFLFKTCSLSNAFSFCASPAGKSNLRHTATVSASIADNGFFEESGSDSNFCSKPNEEDLPEFSQGTTPDNKNEVEIFNIKENLDSDIAHKVLYATCSLSGSVLEDKSDQICEAEKSCQQCKLEKEENDKITSNGSSKFPSTCSQPMILLVEDNRINIMVAKSMLKQLGHKIDVVHNGLEAIYAVQRTHYDLILMDVCMPVMDGLQATKHIRFFEKHGYWDAAVTCPESPTISIGPKKCEKRTTIIAMTANAMAESAADCLDNGMDSFISKPVTFEKLRGCLQQFFSC
ncbi:probable histidine kinase 1 [Phalaenopsis equestris]|uniref:probable histidine kinase 1 n=1 Tax=Phalaenopsis equestris TaxID=78828 RepID=UPI0009E5F75D|nr:probable histidine kinase 1 [Phalaenopsis equestris]